jgi:hypothetical protein
MFGKTKPTEAVLMLSVSVALSDDADSRESVATWIPVAEFDLPLEEFIRRHLQPCCELLRKNRHVQMMARRPLS